MATAGEFSRVTSAWQSALHRHLWTRLQLSLSATWSSRFNALVASWGSTVSGCFQSVLPWPKRKAECLCLWECLIQQSWWFHWLACSKACHRSSSDLTVEALRPLWSERIASLQLRSMVLADYIHHWFHSRSLRPLLEWLRLICTSLEGDSNFLIAWATEWWARSLSSATSCRYWLWNCRPRCSSSAGSRG